MRLNRPAKNDQKYRDGNENMDGEKDENNRLRVVVSLLNKFE